MFALAEHPSPASALDLAGVWADLAAGMAVAILVGLVASAWRPLAIVVGVAWVAINYANYESIRALGSLLNLGFIGYVADPTFLFGSALAPLRPVVLLGLVVVTSALVWVGSREAATRSPWRASLMAAGILLVGLPLFPSTGAEYWRQTHVLTGNLRWLLTGGGATVAGGSLPTSGDLLEGTRFVGEAAGATNVLLIMVEAVSGAYVASNAAAHGLSSSITMQRLSALAERSLNYSTFVVQQVQTNRGEYTILCGDYPKLALGSPKMSDAVAADTVLSDCLPEQLKRLGYLTVYMQSAPLPFMLKDQFMPLSGFSRSYGESWFREAYARDMWGVDDRAFFEQALELVEELGAEEKPWLLTLLTSGTHHPYRAPVEVLEDPSAGADPFERAMRYADDALAEFVGRLETLGVLDNTLVLITADESNGLHEGTDAVTSRLSRNWGPLVVMEPGRSARRIDQPSSRWTWPPPCWTTSDTGTERRHTGEGASSGATIHRDRSDSGTYTSARPSPSPSRTDSYRATTGSRPARPTSPPGPIVSSRRSERCPRRPPRTGMC